MDVDGAVSGPQLCVYISYLSTRVRMYALAKIHPIVRIIVEFLLHKITFSRFANREIQKVLTADHRSIQDGVARHAA